MSLVSKTSNVHEPEFSGKTVIFISECQSALSRIHESKLSFDLLENLDLNEFSCIHLLLFLDSRSSIHN